MIDSLRAIGSATQRALAWPCTLALALAGCLDHDLPPGQGGDGGVPRVFIAVPRDFRDFQDWEAIEVAGGEPIFPALRDARPSRAERPTMSVLDWPQMSLCMLHWQDEPWIRLRDMPCVLADDPFNQRGSWWRKASRVLRGF